MRPNCQIELCWFDSGRCFVGPPFPMLRATRPVRQRGKGSHMIRFRRLLFTRSRFLGSLLMHLVRFCYANFAFAATQCGSPQNAIVAENCLTGNPASEWDISPNNAGDPTIQGFATDISV